MGRRRDGGTDITDELGKLSLKVNEIKLPHESNFAGKSIAELDIRGKGGFVVVALKRESGEIIRHPANDETVEGGNTLIVLGHAEDIPKFVEKNLRKREIVWRGIKTEVVEEI
jgi:voltage-gated potassium channel